MQGVKFEGVAFRIKPRGKFKVYYGVVTAGKRLGKTLKYSLPGVEPYPLERLYKSRKQFLTQNLIQKLLMEIRRIHDS